MSSFKGPWSQDLDTFKKSVQSMPDQYKSSFASASKETLEKLCDSDVLHVWETDSDIDNLLQLTSVIAKICNLGASKDKVANVFNGNMLIIAEEKGGRNNFLRICQLISHLTGADGKRHFEGTVAAFGTIVVVKGWNNSVRSDTGLREAGVAVKRINTSIERVFKIGKFPSGKKKIVWHHGAVVHFLLHFINATTSNIRSLFYAITVTGSLDLTDSVKPSPTGRANTLPDLNTLESYAKKLDVPVVFLDSSSQMITSEYLATYMYYYAYYINTFLPPSLSRPHLHKAQDQLITFAFQILGASKSKYGENIVKLVKEHLDPKAKTWAQACINPDNYDKPSCRLAGKEPAIHHAVQLADGPFALFTHGNGLPAFTRLSVGPAASDSIHHHIAAPAHISFRHSRLRPCSPTHFHILLPLPASSSDKTTHRIQGLMMAVLERIRIRQNGSAPPAPFSPDASQKKMWAALVASCTYALDQSRGHMPKHVEQKVGFVKEKLTRGTWGFVVGAQKGAGGGEGERDGGGGSGSGAARANREAVEACGAGVDVGVGHSVPMQMGGFAPASGHGGGGWAAGAPAPVVQQGGGGGGGGGGGYAQSMGGNWL